MDLALTLTADGQFDIALSGADVATDDGLNSAILLSLLTDARADADDDFTGDDPRGYWADSLSAEPDNTGSKLWLRARQKTVPEVLRLARADAEAALAWLVDDGIASHVIVAASREGNRLRLDITMQRPAINTPFTAQYQYVWENQ